MSGLIGRLIVRCGTSRGAGDYVIVPKDSDFRQLAFLFGAPPKVVWLRVGNASTDVIASELRMSITLVVEFTAGGDDARLVLPRM